MCLLRRSHGLRGSGMLFEPYVSQQSALCVVTKANRHTVAQTAAGDYRIVF